MRVNAETLEYPAHVSLDPWDQSAIEQRIAAKADEYLQRAARDADEARDLLDCMADPGMVLSDVIAAVLQLREPAACFTDAERITRFLVRWERAMRPVAIARADWDRDEIEREYCAEQFEAEEE